MRLMKTIFASSPHCSVFRCQAFTAIDLLLKNKYVTVEGGVCVWKRQRGGVGGNCHVFYLKFITKTALFSVRLRVFFYFYFFYFAPVLFFLGSWEFFKNNFSCSNVMQKLSRCIWVLIRCAEPILLFCYEENKKEL